MAEYEYEKTRIAHKKSVRMVVINEKYRISWPFLRLLVMVEGG